MSGGQCATNEIVGLYIMYTHMISQRSKALSKEKTK